MGGMKKKGKFTRCEDDVKKERRKSWNKIIDIKDSKYKIVM